MENLFRLIHVKIKFVFDSEPYKKDEIIEGYLEIISFNNDENSIKYKFNKVGDSHHTIGLKPNQFEVLEYLTTPEDFLIAKIEESYYCPSTNVKQTNKAELTKQLETEVENFVGNKKEIEIYEKVRKGQLEKQYKKELEIYFKNSLNVKLIELKKDIEKVYNVDQNIKKDLYWKLILESLNNVLDNLGNPIYQYFLVERYKEFISIIK